MKECNVLVFTDLDVSLRSNIKKAETFINDMERRLYSVVITFCLDGNSGTICINYDSLLEDYKRYQLKLFESENDFRLWQCHNEKKIISISKDDRGYQPHILILISTEIWELCF